MYSSDTWRHQMTEDLYGYNEDIEKFRGRHFGKTGYVVGEGCSIVGVPEINLKIPFGAVTIAVNRSLMKYTTARYAFTADHTYVEQMLERALVGSAHAMKPDIIMYESAITRLRTYPLQNERITLYRRKQDNDDFRMDAKDKQLIVGRGSVHCAVHLAHIMGLNPIILLGCDCAYTDGAYAFWQIEKEYCHPFFRPAVDKRAQDLSDSLHFPGYVESQKLDGYLGVQLWAWGQIKEQNPHVNILNASGGNLECFERVRL